MACTSCGGAGRRGLLGARGFGLISKPCRFCDGLGSASTADTSLASDGAADAPQLIAAPAVSAPPVPAAAVSETDACAVVPEASQSFLAEAESLPEALPAAAPAYTHHLSSLSLADVRAKLEARTWAIDEYLCSTPTPCYDMTTENFVRSDRFPGALMRRTVCMKEMPQNAPKVFAKFLGMPEVSKLTNTWHLSFHDEEIRLFGQTYSHDLACSDRFRTQQFHSYRPHPSGGVEFRFWANFAVIKSMPVGFGMVKGLADRQTEAEYVAAIPYLMRVLSKDPVETSSGADALSRNVDVGPAKVPALHEDAMVVGAKHACEQGSTQHVLPVKAAFSSQGAIRRILRRLALIVFIGLFARVLVRRFLARATVRRSVLRYV